MSVLGSWAGGVGSGFAPGFEFGFDLGADLDFDLGTGDLSFFSATVSCSADCVSAFSFAFRGREGLSRPAGLRLDFVLCLSVSCAVEAGLGLRVAMVS